MSLKLQDGAILIADSHYSHSKTELLDFFRDIRSKNIKTTQIILLGDIFDALFGGVDRTYQNNKVLIELIQEVSKDIEIIYIEGNHDFNLKDIFLDIKVFPIHKQPVLFKYHKKSVLFAHGDILSNTTYKIYTVIIRNKVTLFVLNLLNNLLNNKILNKLDLYLNKKNDCTEFTGFYSYILNRLDGSFKCDYFIEGHFHQNKNIKLDDFIYINLPSFACNQRYFTVKSSEELELIEEIYLKGDVNGTSS
jgi:UDP-2,3-diacylglucosamine hydrolase